MFKVGDRVRVTGDNIGIKVSDRVRSGDTIYKVTD